MDIAEATRLLESIDKIADEDFTEMTQPFLESAVRYANIRAEWALRDLAWRKANNEGRTKAHEALIERCNLLSQRMEKLGQDTQWRRGLGDDRKCIGDFACLLHAALGISAR